ncbi:MAG TPA: hypothetical protein VJ821_05270 [Anaerolineales bacterium]|nr:hypothetical protein [Anaerolineales bacterium]
MLYYGKLRGMFLRLLTVIGLVIVAVIPVRSWASAQKASTPAWVIRSLYTSEYGVSDPKGLAFSSEENTFFVLDGSANATLIEMGADPAGTRALSTVQDDPLNAAFDARTNSLFVFNRGTSELARVQADGKGSPTHFAVNALGVANPQGIAFGPEDGHLFVLDAENAQIVSVAPHSTRGFDVIEALRSNNVRRISLKKLGSGLRGIAYNPVNGHMYVSDPGRKKLHELTESGELVSSFDLAALEISNPSAMTFAPSVDNTDDPGTYDLFILDSGTTSRQADSGGKIVEISFQAPAALPPGTTLLPSTLVQIIDTSNASWNPSSPDPAGIDYFPLTGRLLISDSEVDEMRPYYAGANVFETTTSGSLEKTCDTTSFTGEPTGVAINPNNNHIFFAADYQDKLFEVSLGPDGIYCTADDTFTTTSLGTAYGVTDAEDVAYGNNTIFIAGGDDAEVFRIPLGPDGVAGGGDDGPMTHWDTAAMGFSDTEAIGFNQNAGTLFIASTRRPDRYLGETTTSGTLLRAYDLSFMPDEGNIRSDVTYAPSSQNPSVKNIYIVSRGVDNDDNRYENDGKIWEISIGSPPGGPTPTPTHTPTQTSTPTATQTATPTTPPSNLPGKASLITPSGTISSFSPAYTWNKVNAATWYYLWISKINGDGSVTTVHNKWYESSVVCGSSTCSITPAVTLGSGNYRWWIQTWNSFGYGPWSDAMNFSTPPLDAATLISPSGNILSTTPNYTWNKVTVSTWYYLWISRVNGDGSLTTVHTQWYESSVVCGSSTCSITPAVTLGSGNYRWWIQTWNTGSYGPWSGPTNFTVLP